MCPRKSARLEQNRFPARFIPLHVEKHAFTSRGIGSSYCGEVARSIASLISRRSRVPRDLLSKDLDGLIYTVESAST
jgi:hypothetical protein